MIIDTPRVIELMGGGGPILPQTGDAQLAVPPIGNITLPLMSSSAPLGPNIVATQVSSFYQTSGDVRTNQALTTATACVFGKGLWEIDILWNLGYLGVARSTLENFLRFDITALNVTIATIPLNVGNIQQIVARKFEIIFRTDTTLTIGFGTTGVAETLVSQLSVIANKRL